MTEAQNPQPAQSTGAPKPTGAAKPPDRRPTLGSRPAFWPTAILAAASFLLLFEFLSFQLTHGKDPALGGTPTSATAKPQRPVLVRRVVNTRVIADGGTNSGTNATVSSSAASSGSASSGAAAAAAPAPAAPAPAAPVVSSSS